MVKAEVEKLCRMFPLYDGKSDPRASRGSDPFSPASPRSSPTRERSPRSLPAFESRPAQRRDGRGRRRHAAERRRAARRGRHRHRQNPRLSRSRHPQRPARARLHRHQESSGTDLLQGPRGPARRARRAVHRDLHEGPGKLPLPSPVRIVSRVRPTGGTLQLFGESAAQVFLPDHRAVGQRRPRPAIAQRSPICRKTCRSGARSPPRRRTASAPSARAISDCFVTRMRHACGRVESGRRQPSPAVRRRGRPAERVRRGHPRMPATRSSTKRTNSRTSPRSISASSVSNYRFDELARDGERLIGDGRRRREGSRAARRRCDRARDARARFLQDRRPQPAVRTSQAAENRVRVTATILRTVLRGRRAAHGLARSCSRRRPA